MSFTSSNDGSEGGADTMVGTREPHDSFNQFEKLIFHDSSSGFRANFNLEQSDLFAAGSNFDLSQ